MNIYLINRRLVSYIVFIFACFFSEKSIAQQAQSCSVQASMAITIRPAVSVGFAVTINALNAAFKNTSTNATKYIWNFGDGQSSTVENPSHQFSTAGTYTVFLTAINDCGSKTTQMIVVIKSTQISDIVNKYSIKIYPNPVLQEHTALTLEPQGFENQPTTLIFTNLLGQMVLKETLPVFSGKISLETQNLQAGIHFIQVWQSGKMINSTLFLRL
jgi:PKD repeat protein